MEAVVCPCGSDPCRTLGVNAGATWFYEATRKMGAGERMMFRADHASPLETRGLTLLAGLAVSVLKAQQPHLFSGDRPDLQTLADASLLGDR